MNLAKPVAVATLFAAAMLAAGCASEPAIDAPSVTDSGKARLASVLAAQPPETQARYVYRNPDATLTYFGIEPGMTVVEALPGGGWYSKILMSYLGADGALVGANYPMDLWPNFGFMNEERLKAMETWSTDWPETASGWVDGEAAPVSAFVFGSAPAEMAGQADAVLFVRALHNLARFTTDERDFIGQAMGDAYTVLKPGGIVGIVQHEAPASASDEWASGSRGYIKRTMVIERMQAAGFEYLGSTNINANPKDKPGADDIVWRLPPSLRADTDEQKAANAAIGESNRMTLKFRKPA